MSPTEYAEICRDLNAPASPSALHPMTAVTCLHANIEMLAGDFPDLSAIGGMERECVHAWIEKEFGWISCAQAEAEGSFFEIQACAIDREAKGSGLRQDHMGRACMIGVEIGGNEFAFELKGCGVHDGIIPFDGDHQNGFMGMLPAVKEYYVSYMLNSKFRSGTWTEAWRPAKIYAILRYDFTCRRFNESFHCCLLVREPTPRANGGGWPDYGAPEWERIIDAELYLRSLGVTSAIVQPFELGPGIYTDMRRSEIIKVRHEDSELDDRIRTRLESIGKPFPYRANIVNIQIAAGVMDSLPLLVDMEHYKLSSRFGDSDPFAIPCGDMVLGFGGELQEYASLMDSAGELDPVSRIHGVGPENHEPFTEFYSSYQDRIDSIVSDDIPLKQQNALLTEYLDGIVAFRWD